MDMDIDMSFGLREILFFFYLNYKHNKKKKTDISKGI